MMLFLKLKVTLFSFVEGAFHSSASTSSLNPLQLQLDHSDRPP